MNIVDVSKIEGPIAIFWTGGWDSTYRVVELSRQKVTVQPIYVLDEDRSSCERELQSIEKITNMLNEREETQGEILPIKIIKVKDIPKNKDISKKIKNLRKTYGWGEQHDWTARVATMYPGIEMCIEKVTKGYMPTRKIIKDHGELELGPHGYQVKKEVSDEYLMAALGNITLPIFETTEVEMLENIKEWGYEDVMENIWFCHKPINGKPCGFCSPCHTKYDSGMEFMLSKEAQERCKMITEFDKKYGKFIGRQYRKIYRMFIKE
ncbi:MAG: hypothetical protein E7396_01545 [Ruminococcaceae bacterium]|nr:hypothetical protein [Oscillospiraceae bacterium]